MSRIDRARYDAADFPVSVDIPTRFADIDIQGHVNNTAAVVLLQEARVAFNRRAGLGDKLDGLRSMVAALTVEYAAEMRFPEPVTIATATLAVGRTSITIAQRATQGGRACLYAQAVMVAADANGPAAIPETLRAAYERLAIG